MRHRYLAGLMVAAFLLVAAPLGAADDNRSEAPPAASSSWYGAIGLGWNFAENITPDGTDRRLEFDLGLPSATLTLGRYLRDGWRLELDASYRGNDLEIVYLGESGAGIQPHPSDALHSLSGQLSLLRDFRRRKALQPYLGAGLGLSHLDLTIRNAGDRPVEVLLEDSDWAWSWQLIAGFSVPMGSHWDFAADYRFWQAPSATFRDIEGESQDFQHQVHSGTLHLRYLFSPRAERMTAAPATGAAWYAAANLGLGYAVDAEIEGSLENFDAFKVGPSATLAGGYDSGRRWRWELEVARRKNDVEIIDFSPLTGQFGATGRVIADSVMANALYQFRPDKAIRPILGMGLGMAFADYDVSVTDGPEAGPYVDDAAVGPAFQAIVGIDYAMTEHLTLTADCRSWIGWDLKMKRPDGEALETWHWVNSMSLGLRIAVR